MIDGIGEAIKEAKFICGGGRGGEVTVLETKVAKFATRYSLSFIFLKFYGLL